MLAEISYHTPVFSAVLLLIAGALVGYALSYPKRGDGDSIRDQLHELKDQNDDLHDALTQQRDAYARLERKYSDQRDEWTLLRAASQRMEESLRQQGVAHANVEANLETLQQIKTESRRDLAIEREERSKIEAALISANGELSDSRRQLAEMRGELEELRKLREIDVTKKGTESSPQLVEIQAQCDALQAEYEDSLITIEQLTDQLQLAHEQQTLVADDRDGDAPSVERMQRMVDLLQQRMIAIQEERDHALTRYDNESQQRMALESMLQHNERQLAMRSDEIAEYETLAEKTIELQKLFAQTKANLDRVSAERDDAITAAEAASDQLAIVVADLQSHQRAFEVVERKRAALQESLEKANGSLQAYQSGIDKKQHVLEQTQIELEQKNQRLKSAERDRDEAVEMAEHQRQQTDELRGEIAELKSTVDRIRSEREELLDQLRGEQSRVALLEEEQQRLTSDESEEVASLHTRLTAAEQQVATIQPLSEQLASTLAELETAQQQVAELRAHDEAAEVKQQQAEEIIQQLRVELRKSGESITELRTHRVDQSDELHKKLRQYETALDQMRPTLAELRQQLAQSEERMTLLAGQESERLDSLESELERARRAHEEQNSLISNLREELAERASLIGELKDEHHALKAPTQRAIPKRSEPVELRRDARLGLVYTSRPERVDDLTRISGVAATLEQRLNEFGVYTYEQIMNWDPVAIDEFSEHFAFGDRISRECWVQQARELHSSEYRRSA